MASRSTEKLKIIKSSGNIFSDLELVNPEKHLAKVKLAYQINSILEKRRLKQVEAAEILGIDQPKISDLNCGRLDGFSIERLIGFLNKLDRDVEIVVKMKPTRRKTHGYLKVAVGENILRK
jgi:predicted XRE-type DNA-binding protein